MDLETFMTLVQTFEELEPPGAKQLLLDLVLRPAALVPGQYNVDEFADVAMDFLERLRDAGLPTADIDEAQDVLTEFMNQQPAEPATGGP